MFNKLGRAGGGGRGGNGKRSLPPPIRPVGPAASKSRIPVASSAAAAATLRRGGGGRGSGGGGGGQVPEETFSMVSGGPLDFASIIRLTPDLVEGIRRAEERCGAVRIKFDSNSNESSSNVIDVDGKEFRFTWSKDSGVLCDIYEERRSGESGNGLLAERGSAWRKLNVLRILDESLKNHVKMRSEEAERQLKARRAIVLDPANPSVKNQSSASIEGSMRRMHWKQKNEPPYKKQKAEITQAPKFGQSKPVHKSRVSPNVAAKVGKSLSPILSPPEKTASRTSASLNLLGSLVTADIVTPVASNKEDVASSEKETNERTVQVSQKIFRHKGGVSSRPMDLRNMLITLLVENPKGITSKAIEKAVREALPNSTKKIENVLRNVANFQSPGRYFLKPGLGIESSNRPQSESGSSPENAGQGATVADAMEKANYNPFEQQHISSSEQAQESDIFEKSNIHNIGHDPFTNDEKVKNENEVRAHSSSESGSDSESESDSSDSGSDSGSQSRSRSKSKSPIVSGSGSSSDSDSDASSSSKEANVDVDVDADADVDVDITTSDDEKDGAKSKLLAANFKASSPGTWTTYDGQCKQKDRNKQDDHVPSPELSSFNVEIHDDTPHAIKDAKINLIDSNAKLSENPETAVTHPTGLNGCKTTSESLEEKVILLSNQQNHSESKQVISDYRQTDISERTPKPKSKKPSKINNLQENMGSATKPNASVAFHSSGNRIGTNSSEELSYMPSEKFEQNQHKDPSITSDIFQYSSTVNNSHTDYENAVPGRRMSYGNLNKKRHSPDFQKFSNFDARESGHTPGDPSTRRKYLSTEKSDRSFENFGRSTKHSERMDTHPDESDAPTTRSMASLDKFSMLKDKQHKGTQDEDTHSGEKSTAKIIRVNVVAEERPSSPPDSHYRKSGEGKKIQKDTGQMAHMHNAEIDILPGADVTKGGSLSRCFSELEVGEFREPFSMEDIQGSKGQLERKVSPSALNEVNAVDNVSFGLSKGRTSGKVNSGSRRSSPSSVEGRSRKGQEGFQRTVAENFIESSRPQQRSQHLSRRNWIDSEPASHFDGRSSHLFDAENRMAGYTKNPASFPDGNKAVFETKHQKSTESRDSADLRKNNSKRNGNSNGGKGTESSPEEDFLFSKFEKDEPELRGPINNFPQYKDYIQEYEEKYECYLGLRNQMEKIQNEFLKICRDLPELSRQRDTEAYNYCYRLARNFHCQHKMRLTRLKKLFTVVYEELATIKYRIKIFAEEYTRERGLDLTC